VVKKIAAAQDVPLPVPRPEQRRPHDRNQERRGEHRMEKEAQPHHHEYRHGVHDEPLRGAVEQREEEKAERDEPDPDQPVAGAVRVQQG
jgi:hypothetical protein